MHLFELGRLSRTFGLGGGGMIKLFTAVINGRESAIKREQDCTTLPGQKLVPSSLLKKISC